MDNAHPYCSLKRLGKNVGVTHTEHGAWWAPASLAEPVSTLTAREHLEGPARPAPAQPGQSDLCSVLLAGSSSDPCVWPIQACGQLQLLLLTCVWGLSTPRTPAGNVGRDWGLSPLDGTKTPSHLYDSAFTHRSGRSTRFTRSPKALAAHCFLKGKLPGGRIPAPGSSSSSSSSTFFNI